LIGDDDATFGDAARLNMAWPAVDELVWGWVQRSYLKEYRWWLELVLDGFAFLEGLGFCSLGTI
jgi:hypothetical protein